MKTKCTALVVVAAASVFVTCGGDDSDSSAKKDESSNTSAALPPGIDVSKDDRIVENAVLKLEDLPAGWRDETRDDEDDDEDPYDLDECGAIQSASASIRAARTARAESGHFVQGQGEIENDVTATSSEDDLTTLFAELGNAREANACLTAVVNKQLEEVPRGIGQPNVKVNDVAVGRTSIGNFGDDAISYQLEVEAEADGVSASVYVDVVFVRVNRYAALFFFVDVFNPVDATVQQDIVETVASRLEKAAN
jgi:hypothetical protein